MASIRECFVDVDCKSATEQEIVWRVLCDLGAAASLYRSGRITSGVMPADEAAALACMLRGDGNVCTVHEWR